MKIDPYKHEAKYRQWKQRGAPIPRILESDANLIRRFLFDLELGLNVSRASKRGPRSFHRLNTLRVRLASLSRNFAGSPGYEGFAGLNEERVHTLFAEMRSGGIRRVDGKEFLAVGDHVKDFRTFWRWYIEVQRKAGSTVPDVSMYLDSRDEKPKWVYLTEDQVRLLCNEAKFEYRVLMMFLLDSGVRSPSELINLRLCDFDEDFKRVQIRDEVSKTFGRRINLLLSSDLIRDHVLRNKLSGQVPVFSICPTAVNRYLQRLAVRVLGNGVSLAGERYAKLTMYDSGAVVVQTAEFDATGRRMKKTVTNSGIHNGVVVYLYDGHKVLETRNGSNQVVQQFVHGAQYVDECSLIIAGSSLASIIALAPNDMNEEVASNVGNSTVLG